MTTGQEFNEAFEAILKSLPEGIMFDMTCSHGRKLHFQAHTREDFRRIRDGLPGLIWRKTWDKCCKWWQFDAEFGEWKIHVYAVRENPPTCKAITEKKIVKVKIPTAFEEKEEEQEVIVGWDCGKADDPQEVEA